MTATDSQVLWLKLLPALNEAQARWYAAQKAIELGHGGIERVHRLTGMSRPTIRKGIRELLTSDHLDATMQVRRPGAGRKRVEVNDPALLRALEKILEETTAGDPMSALKWTAKSVRAIARELTHLGHPVSPDTVDRMLHDLGYSLQVNQKTKEGSNHPDRDTQFRYINAQVKRFAAAGNPVLSVDCKKKERVGDFKNAGATWRKQGTPRDVNVYDFPRLAVGTAIPYGAYDVQRNEGLVNVGITHETAEFAVESIRQWWRRVGHQHYAQARSLLVCADNGGGNGSRNRAWRLFLQELADQTELSITVCHYPPGASKWNKVEHRMFSFISLNWRGEPLISYETVVNLIGATTTHTGLRVRARLDRRAYKTGRKVSRDEFKALRITPHDVLPRWNYTIKPRSNALRHGRS